MFTRIVRKKNGRQYLYVEERYREEGKVRSRSRCLGPVDAGARQPGWLRAQFPPTHGLDWDKIEREMLERAKQEQAKADLFAARMYADYRMILTTSPVPIEKPPSPHGLLSQDRPPDATPSATGTPEAPGAASPASATAPAAEPGQEMAAPDQG